MTPVMMVGLGVSIWEENDDDIQMCGTAVNVRVIYAATFILRLILTWYKDDLSQKGEID